MSEQCVKVRFPYPSSDLSELIQLEDQLIAAIESAGAGEFDGNEVGGGDAELFMYGPSADLLFHAVRPTLLAHALTRAASVLIRYGPSGSPEHSIVVSSLE
jgi:hypothetical protein